MPSKLKTETKQLKTVLGNSLHYNSNTIVFAYFGSAYIFAFFIQRL